MDGGMVNIWGEDWKEFKVALVGSVVADEPPESNLVPGVVITVKTLVKSSISDRPIHILNNNANVRTIVLNYKPFSAVYLLPNWEGMTNLCLPSCLCTTI